VFIARILPLLPRGLLQFLAGCLRDQSNWATFKTRILQEYFPHFVRERFIRNFIVFNFHQKGVQVRTFIDQNFQAVGLPSYGATEQQLFEMIIMNLHPEILMEAAFLNKPNTRDELFHDVDQIEERLSVAEERRSVEKGTRENNSRGVSPGRFQRHAQAQPPRKIKCWNCGQTGHVRNKCPYKKATPTIGGEYIKRRQTPSVRIMNSFHKAAAVPEEAPLWVMVRLKCEEIPALLDTGA